MLSFVFLASALSFSSLAAPVANSQCQAPWHCSVAVVKKFSAAIRTGYLAQNPKVPFLGNVMYFEGLGDSMMNHQPLFTKLTDAGFRVISFDYMGQGGSQGRMTNTRINQISKIGDFVWKKHADQLVKFPKKRIIGWSTGGLAAYLTAHDKRADQVVLIAPGIRPNTVVGEGLFHWPINEITVESLTTDRYAALIDDPHVDPIRPISPVNVLLGFGLNLLITAKQSTHWKIDSKIQGFVLLSGDDDTYVDAKKTRETIESNASHFLVKSYPGALHEIDNERYEIREAAHRDILKFLKAGKID